MRNSTRILLLAANLAGLCFPIAASAQHPPQQLPPARVALRDESGVIRAIMTIRPSGLIVFSLPSGAEINRIQPGGTGGAAAAGPPIPESVRHDEPADELASMRSLQRQIDTLRADLNAAIRRLNGR